MNWVKIQVLHNYTCCKYITIEIVLVMLFWNWTKVLVVVVVYHYQYCHSWIVIVYKLFTSPWALSLHSSPSLRCTQTKRPNYTDICSQKHYCLPEASQRVNACPLIAQESPPPTEWNPAYRIQYISHSSVNFFILINIFYLFKILLESRFLLSLFNFGSMSILGRDIYQTAPVTDRGATPFWNRNCPS